MNYIKISCLLLLTNFSQAYCQDILPNKYGLVVIKNLAQYRKSTAFDSTKEMIEINDSSPGIRIDLKYAGSQNFTGQKLYPVISKTYLRKNAFEKLRKVAAELKKTGLGIKIWDAYRPYSITEKMWEFVKDERYAASPAKGSGHNRGIAIDLTLIFLNNNQELDMGTDFDNFSDTAHHDFRHLNDTILANRKLLKSLLEKFGFKSLDTEWWHYSVADASRYEILNVSFKELAKQNRREKNGKHR